MAFLILLVQRPTNFHRIFKVAQKRRRKKNSKVINRISQVVEEHEQSLETESESIKKETVRMFLLNKHMWKKYVNLEQS